MSMEKLPKQLVLPLPVRHVSSSRMLQCDYDIDKHLACGALTFTGKGGKGNLTSKALNVLKDGTIIAARELQ
jgi:hypothetical protein